MVTAMVTLHDVMPQRRHAVQELLAFLRERAPQVAPGHITLLVVPGCDWSAADLAWLRHLVAQGHPLAGHGWSHRAKTPATLYHWLHSLLLSRDVAEHLSRSASSCYQRVQRCHDWFDDNDLPGPHLYVPPAWALGKLDGRHRAALPFRYFEDLGGIYDSQQRQYHRLPLVGFEADTVWRAHALKLFNSWNLFRARQSGRPLRIALHPDDSSYLLAKDIGRYLGLATRFTGVEAVSAEATQLC